ncbi:GerAB/ArcD/ProY family transporter [Niallia sp. Krafla_26]|uniref:GerAB/ArcD/ProY family transporter n=1 Tax=Niallia sp. Krafla_26 TaxID=3064703 RepID=UPI003D176492
MSRYFYYITFINMITSMVASMPKILLLAKEKGAIYSILLAIPIGLVFCFLIGRFFQTYPGKGLPELMKESIPKPITKPFLFVTGMVWFSAGLLSVITYSFFIKRFLSPNTSLIFIVSLILLFIYYGALMKSKSVLYTIEIIFILTIPLIFLIMIKAFTNEDFEWDYVRVAIMHIQHVPQFSTICAAAFVFWGPANLIIFNRVMTHKQSMTWKSILLIGLVGMGVLGSSFFGIIGMLGFEAVSHTVYPGMTTADTLHIKFGVIERVLFVNIILFLSITFTSILIHWHVAVELLKQVIFIKKFKWKDHHLTPHLFLIIFWLVSIKVVTYLTEYQLVKYTSYFYNLFPFLFAVLFVIMWAIKRRVQP